MRAKSGLSFFLVLLLLASCAREYSRTEFLLGTTCTIRTWGGGEKALSAAFERIREIELRMSTHLPDSEINRLSTAGTRVSHDTCAVIRKALEFGDLTDGLFDITIAPVVDLWGFGTDTRKVPSDDALKAALDLVDYRRVQIQPDCTVSIDPGQKIDLGGIAKGYAADEAARIMLDLGVERAIINLGGNVLVVGSKKDGSPWKIGIQDPFQPTGSTVGVLEVGGGAVVTSGIYERVFEQGGSRYHHILDPGTGYPVENNLAGVSVAVPGGFDADVLSTAVFLLGIDKGCELLNSFQNSGAVFITRDRNIITYGTASEDFRKTNGSYEIIQRR